MIYNREILHTCVLKTFDEDMTSARSEGTSWLDACIMLERHRDNHALTICSQNYYDEVFDWLENNGFNTTLTELLPSYQGDPCVYPDYREPELPDDIVCDDFDLSL